MSWLREQFSLLQTFLRSDFRRVLLLSALGMALAAAAGFTAALLQPELAAQVIQGFMDQIAQSGVMDSTGGLSVFALLMNNWRAMLTTALYGLIPFLFLPVLSILVNGALLGVMAAIYHAQGLSMVLLAAGLLPHGVLELPAMVLSIACGFRLCQNMCLLVTSSPRRRPMAALLEELLRVMVLLVAPLTAAAAFLECYVTPLVMSLFH